MSDVPDSWIHTHLADVAQWGSGGTPSRTNTAYYGGDIPWIKTGELGQGVITDTEEKITDLGLKNSSAKVFPKGSVAVAMYGATIGKTAVLGIDAATNQACAVGIPENSITTTEYLLYYLASQKDNFVKAGQGGAQPNISQAVIKNWPIPLAPLNEQKRIAEKLDRLLAKVDNCRERLDRIPLILSKIRSSILTQAFSGELTRIFQNSSKYSEDWSYERAADVCEKVQSGGTPKEGFINNPGIPFLKVYNIVNQKVDFEYRPQFILETINSSSMSKSQSKPGDVLMNIVGPPLGKVAIIPNSYPEWNINQAITLFRPSSRITTGWLYYLLCSGINVSSIINETRGSAGQSNISLSQCRDFVFPVPSVQEQNKIVHQIEKLFDFADRLEARYQTARTQIDKLTPALLDKAFKGELVPQDPTDEPAAALLQKIPNVSKPQKTKAASRKKS